MHIISHSQFIQSSIMASIFSIIIALSIAATLSLIEANNGGGFTIDLMHRDSPNSPFYNPTESQSQRIQRALRRSMSRVHRLNPTGSVSPLTATSDVVSANGEYLMNISIGTPPFDVLAIADTGSDLIWTQCNGCSHCYKQDNPLFSPKNSSTYREVACTSQTCQLSGGTVCEAASKNRCQYSVQYGDRSYSLGVIGVDTVTLGSTSARPVQIPKTFFGCGIENDGTFSPEGSGIIGLGGGSASLVSQLKSVINGKFSYCLIPLTSFSSSGPQKTSKMNFGSAGIVSGNGVVSTPLAPKTPATFYYLTLEAISVGNKKVEFLGSESENPTSAEGNIIIDSGTTLTLLPQDFYDRLETEVIKQVDQKRVDDPDHSLSLCYEAKQDFEVPELTAHFKGGDVKLRSYNTFVSIADGIVCFAFAPNANLAIWGNLAQMNFLVGYDLEEKTVSFKPTDCTQ